MGKQNNCKSESDKHSSGVYFILAPNQEKIKIGRSKSVMKRYVNLRTGFMDDGHLMMVLQSEDDVWLEKHLHKMLGAFRSDGEWFYITHTVYRFLASCHTDKSLRLLNIWTGNTYNELFRSKVRLAHGDSIEFRHMVERWLVSKFYLFIIFLIGMYMAGFGYSDPNYTGVMKYIVTVVYFSMGVLVPIVIHYNGRPEQMNFNCWLMLSMLTLFGIDLASRYFGPNDLFSLAYKAKQVTILFYYFGWGNLILHQILFEKLQAKHPALYRRIKAFFTIKFLNR
ncbi:GIY-YIG nuclease family protein [Chryseosolibacter indicus]|uniref:GIY-YIG nuclease family protein n=1 Tax=Chryseosolibacter indicus TaxID=2782351 RepID=A0ABS5VWR4_9BACT|nr:GIY-YIG nuclease family protein [Chryseosolibacter indicus]MBT1705275.1 GIY-YIG nuclease family protein [Chryseosolibacter indicus]